MRLTKTYRQKTKGRNGVNTVLLAAGLSTRMNGRQKLLLPWGDETVIGHCVRQAMLGLGGSGEVTVVTGCDENDVMEALVPVIKQQEEGCFGTTKLQFVHNAHYQEGQFSSTRTGVSAMSGGQPFFISMGDLPLVTAVHYSKLVPLLEGYDAVRPTCNGVPGHPVLHAAKLRDEILMSPASATMRGLLAPKHMKAPDDGDIAWISDIDTPEAYRSLYTLTFGRPPS